MIFFLKGNALLLVGGKAACGQVPIAIGIANHFFQGQSGVSPD